MPDRRRWGFVAAALVVGTIASACAGGSTAGTGASGAANPTLLTPHPKSVTVALDGAKAATAMVPVTGGTLTATGSDGSVFTLTIPDKALGGPEKVTMTPVSTVNGLPFSGGLIAAVQLEPDGLQLFQMATLTIKPAKSVPIENQVAVGYHGSGDDLYMQPLDPVAGISLHILHFSGAGVASGITGEIEEQAKNAPSDPGDQAAQELAAASSAALAAARKDALLGTISDADAAKVAESLKDILGAWFDRVVEAKVAAAEGDYTLTIDALTAALRWERMVQLLGQEDKYKAQSARLEAQLTELKRKYEKALTDRCIGRHDLSAILPLVALERQVQLMGTGAAADPSPLDTVKKCLRFELDFETIAPFVTDEAETFVLHDRVLKLVLEPDFPSGDLAASQPHEILGLTSVDPARAMKNVTSARNFTVTNLSFHMHFVMKPNGKSAPSITGVGITIDPGEVTGIRYDALTNTQIGSAGGVPTYQCPAWEMAGDAGACWAARHHDERSGASTFVIPLDYVGTSLFARKTYDLPCTEYGQDCGGGNEKTTFDLRHAPAS